MIFLRIETPDLLSQMVSVLDARNMAHEVAITDEQLVQEIQNYDSGIVILEYKGKHSIDMVKAVKSLTVHRAFEIILCIHVLDSARTIDFTGLGSFDIIRLPFEPLELELRIKGAELRVIEVSRLLDERRFYQLAVQQEESLASRILDKNITLKQVLDHVRSEVRTLNKDRKELLHKATTDALSGLQNRAALFDLVAMEINRASRNGHPLTALMIDIDNFKRVNDTSGHAVGDSIIKGTGALLRKLLRDYDAAGRYGGEEFVVLLPNTTIVDGMKIADRFRREICVLRFGDDNKTTVTASIGVAQLRDGDDPAGLIKNADKAMYYAKQKGKNCCEAFDNKMI